MKLIPTDKGATLICNRSGGNDPAIVFDDVDVEQVAQKVAGLAFLNSGQVRKRKIPFKRLTPLDLSNPLPFQICLALKRIFVQESIAEKFLPALVEATKNLKVRNPLYCTNHVDAYHNI